MYIVQANRCHSDCPSPFKRYVHPDFERARATWRCAAPRLRIFCNVKDKLVFLAQLPFRDGQELTIGAGIDNISNILSNC